jgi:hypothetical protein
VKAAVEMPLHLAVRQLVLQDTVDFDGGDTEDMETALIRIFSVNAFPVEIKLQVYMLDEAYLVLDKLMDGDGFLLPPAAHAGPPDYRITAPARSTTDIAFDALKMQKLRKSKYMVISGELSTTNQEFVKIYKDNYLKVDVGVKAKVNP